MEMEFKKVRIYVVIENTLKKTTLLFLFSGNNFMFMEICSGFNDFYHHSWYKTSENRR